MSAATRGIHSLSNEDGPFGDVIARIVKKEIQTSSSVEMALRLCSYKLRHLKLICKRLVDEVKQIKDAQEIMNKKTLSGNAPAHRIMDENEAEAFHRYFEFLEFYNLDYEDFLIHTQILLDRMAFLASSILDPDGKVLSHRFSGQRKHFTNPKNMPSKLDEVYAKYVREQTNWFLPLVNVYRNEFITHNENYNPFGSVIQPGEVPRPVTMSLNVQPSDKLLQSLLALKQRYEGTIPGLQAVPINFYELVAFFETNSNFLTDVEIHSLDEVRRAVGAKMPDPNNIADHLLEFMRFFNAHFLQQFCS